MQEILQATSKEMDKSVESLKRDLSKVRTGRASTALVDGIQVEYYGSKMPLNQVSNVTTPDVRTIQVVAWEQSMIPEIEKAILAANIGLNPQNDGKIIRIPLPALTEERRKEMVKLVKKMGEEAKVGIRNHRREANDRVKVAEKEKTISEDDAKKLVGEVQKETDVKVADVDRLVAAKEKEIMTI